MAEGWCRHLHGDRIEAHSAGVDPGRLDPRAVAVMREMGVDISEQFSKSVSELMRDPFDVVVTVCDDARENCPVFPGRATVVHQGFDDPPRLAAVSPGEEALGAYRRVRDEIQAFIEELPFSLGLDLDPELRTREESSS